MCGRFSIFTAQDVLEKRFGARAQGKLMPRYNAAPSQMLPVITSEIPDKIVLAKWGLAPCFIIKPKNTGSLINARMESLDKKPSFRDAFKKTRCLVLADGFYEWERRTGSKIPFRITLKSEEPFAFAGIYETKGDEKGSQNLVFSIITTDANQIISKIHHRMPVILKPKNEKIWLDPDQEITGLKRLLAPYPADMIKMYPVSRAVNSPANENPLIIKPANLI